MKALVLTAAASLNFADTMARLGLHPDAPRTPCALGYEVAGEIESVGEAFPLERAGDAHMLLGEGRNVGKVVLFPS